MRSKNGTETTYNKILTILVSANKPLNADEISEQCKLKYKTVATSLARLKQTKSFQKYISFSRETAKWYYLIKDEYRNNLNIERAVKYLKKDLSELLKKSRNKKILVENNNTESETSKNTIPKRRINLLPKTPPIEVKEVLKTNENVENKNLKDSIIKALSQIIPETPTKIIIPFQTKKGTSIKLEIDGKVKMEELVKFIFKIID